jgi:hypothetical protein
MADRPLGFVSRVREVVTEYVQRGMGPSAAMEEIKAALREYDRSGRAKEGQSE